MDWQLRYQLGDTPWEKGEAAPSLSYLLGDFQFLFSKEKYFFVPGCGLGHDALLLAGKVGRVTGGDIAPMAIEQAKQRGEGFANLEFTQVDLFNLPAQMLGCFDAVWEHTCFCAIEPFRRSDYVRAMWSTLKAEGYLVGVFFINPDVGEGEGPPFGAKVSEIVEVFSSRFTLVSEVEPKAYYHGREQRERILVFRRKGKS